MATKATLQDDALDRRETQMYPRCCSKEMNNT